MLIQYAPLGDQLYVFLVSKENIKIVIAPGKPEELWKKIKTLRKQIISGESGGPLTRNLTSLYDLLIAPIESELEPIKVLAFIPNQLLFYLPMQALAKKQADGSTRYLIEDKQIVYLTAADYRRLKALARATDRTTAELVREAVAEYARRHAPGARPKSLGVGRSGRGDVAERAEELLRGLGRRR